MSILKGGQKDKILAPLFRSSDFGECIGGEVVNESLGDSGGDSGCQT